MLTRSGIVLPAVLRRTLDAYRAGDAVAIGQAFTADASMRMTLDPKLVRRLGLDPQEHPLRAQGAVGIMRFYALELATFDVGHLEVLSAMQVGREVAAVCEWTVKLRGSGIEFAGRCHNIWTLDPTGRKLSDARSVCKIITPGWDHEIN